MPHLLSSSPLLFTGVLQSNCGSVYSAVFETCESFWHCKLSDKLPVQDRNDILGWVTLNMVQIASILSKQVR